jgi:hypothetical protein
VYYEFPQREQYVSVAATLPPNYLDGNAAPLLRAVEELRKSLTQEIVAIQSVRELDATDLHAVERAVRDYGNYIESRDFSHDRTHCANIGRALRALRPPDVRMKREDRERVEELRDLMSFLSTSDAELLDRSSSIVEETLAALREMRDALQNGQTDEATRLHQQFDDMSRQRVREVKAILVRMSELTNDLLDRLGE